MKDLRVFGGIWGFVFVVIAVYPLLDGGALREWAAGVACGFFVVTVFCPVLFKKIGFYQGWIALGGFVGKVNSKIIIILLFYVIFLPMGILLKVFRKDLLSKKIKTSADSYFIDRENQPGSMSNQF